jgi:hypothetical protein
MDAVAISNLVKDHGPIGMFVIGMLLVGSLINKESINQSFAANTTGFPLPTQQWCSSSSSSNSNETNLPLAALLNSANIINNNNNNNNNKNKMPYGFEETVLVLSVVLPMVPLAINRLNEKNNAEMLKAHFAGQTSGYGLSQLLRHFIVYPETNFLNKCNISSQECLIKTAALAESSNHVFNFFTPNDADIITNKTFHFCNRSLTPETWKELFDSMHHVPNSTCFQLGSSLVTMFAILFYWHRLNVKKESPYNTSASLQIAMICLQCILINALGLYSYYLYVSFDSIQIFGILLGAALQFCIIVAMLRHVQ